MVLHSYTGPPWQSPPLHLLGVLQVRKFSPEDLTNPPVNFNGNLAEHAVPQPEEPDYPPASQLIHPEPAYQPPEPVQHPHIVNVSSTAPTFLPNHPANQPIPDLWAKSQASQPPVPSVFLKTFCSSAALLHSGAGAHLQGKLLVHHELLLKQCFPHVLCQHLHGAVQ